MPLRLLYKPAYVVKDVIDEKRHAVVRARVPLYLRPAQELPALERILLQAKEAKIDAVIAFDIAVGHGTAEKGLQRHMSRMSSGKRLMSSLTPSGTAQESAQSPGEFLLSEGGQGPCVDDWEWW